MRKKFYILSIDGGGLKGLIAIKILQLVETIMQQPLTSKFNLLAGTSTGGLIAAALAVKDENNGPLYDLEYIENIYLEVGQHIFKQGAFSMSGNEVDKFNTILDSTFGDKRLDDTLVPIFVPTYALNEHKIIVFKTRSAILNSQKNVTLFDVCRATSAIPPIFPTFTLTYAGRKVNCIDGGLYLKNPSIAVLGEIWKHKGYYVDENFKEEDIIMLSISTGRFASGNKDWSNDINDVIEGQSESLNYLKSQKLSIDLEKINYLRIDLNLGSGGFSFANVMNWMSKLEELESNTELKNAIHKLLNS